MARIRSFEQGRQNVRLAPSEVDCFFQQIDAPDGTRYLHLSTFGSDNRASESKSSQSIQLDELMARHLVEIIENTFGPYRPATAGDDQL